MSEHHDDFMERVVRPLRRPETLAPDFDARLMASINAGTSAACPVLSSELRHAGWWRRPRAIRTSPIALLGMAAGFAGFVALATLASADRLTKDDRVSAAIAPATDTVHMVRFVFAEPRARSVALVGDFNGWAAEATPLAHASEGDVWSVLLPLEKGRHEYAFVVDGQRWAADPAARAVSDEFSTPSSVVAVGLST